jgi:hypothetical protein
VSLASVMSCTIPTTRIGLPLSSMTTAPWLRNVRTLPSEWIARISSVNGDRSAIARLRVRVRARGPLGRRAAVAERGRGVMPGRTLGHGALSRAKVGSETGHQEPTESRADVGAILDGLPAMVSYWDSGMRDAKRGSVT